jgi:hypothetical protein
MDERHFRTIDAVQGKKSRESHKCGWRCWYPLPKAWPEQSAGRGRCSMVSEFGGVE